MAAKTELLKFAVMNRWSGEPQFEAEIDCAADALPGVKLGLAVKWALKAGANLAGAKLARAYLADANLIDGGQRSDGYRFVGSIKDGSLMILAGCRYFTIEAAREHWKYRDGTPLGAETTCILDHIEKVAAIRGLLPATKQEAA